VIPNDGIVWEDEGKGLFCGREFGGMGFYGVWEKQLCNWGSELNEGSW